MTDLPSNEGAREDEQKLYPLLRPAVTAGVPLVRVPFAPLLYAYVAADEGERLRLLTPQDAGRLGKSHHELVTLALGNLGELEHTVEPIDPEAPFPALQVVARDEYRASRLLLPGLLKAFEAPLGGPAACAVPDGARLAVVPREDPAAVLWLYELALETWGASTDPVSPSLFALDEEGDVAPLVLPEDHPAKELELRATALFLARAYEDQKRVVDEALEREGLPVHVASCTAISHPTLGVLTVSPFVEGVEALLPVTHAVQLHWQDGAEVHSLLVLSEHLVQAAPQLLVLSEDFDPPRFVTSRFPTREELARIAEVALARSSRPADGDEDEAPAPTDPQGAPTDPQD